MIRLIYFIVLFLGLEFSLSFFYIINFGSQVINDFSSELESSEILAKDTILHISRYLEISDIIENKNELDSYIARIIASRSESNINNFGEILILSTDGSVSYRDKQTVVTNNIDMNENMPVFMKALRMRRGQVEINVLQKNIEEEKSFLSRKLSEKVPASTEMICVVSAPLYQSHSMLISGGVHLIFKRLDPDSFIESRLSDFRDGFYWIFGIGLFSSVILFFMFLIIVEKIVHQRLSEESYEFQLNKKVEKKPEELKQEVDKNSTSLDAVYLE